jgi:hypothetical protein
MAKQLNNKVVISQAGVEATFKLSDKELRNLRHSSRYTRQEKESGRVDKATMGNAYNFSMYAFFEHETTRAKSGRFYKLFDYHKGDFFWYLDE